MKCIFGLKMIEASNLPGLCIARQKISAYGSLRPFQGEKEHSQSIQRQAHNVLLLFQQLSPRVSGRIETIVSEVGLQKKQSACGAFLA